MPDVVVYGLPRATVTLVSANAAGTDSGNGRSADGMVSAYGTHVAFLSEATDLGPTDTNGVQDVYVRDLVTGVTTLVSANATGTDAGNGASGTGAHSVEVKGGKVAFGQFGD